MKKLFTSIVLICGISLMTACDSNKSKQISAEDLLHHRFVLVSANGNNIPIDQQIFIEFNERLMINGKMCNTFFGQAHLENDILKSSDLATTDMLCGNSQLDELDSVISQLLTNGATISLEKNRLKLKDTNHELIYELKDLM